MSGTSTGMTLDAILARHAEREGPLLPILHDVQAEFGFVSEDTIQAIALALNLSRAEVSGVVSFYHDFKRTAETRPVIKLCRAEACQARGSEPLAAFAERVAGDRVKVATVYCLGLCSIGPSAMVGEDIYARLDETKVSELIGAL
jgi:formate dehydrogenase subunit gamma